MGSSKWLSSNIASNCINTSAHYIYIIHIHTYEFRNTRIKYQNEDGSGRNKILKSSVRYTTIQETNISKHTLTFHALRALLFSPTEQAQSKPNLGVDGGSNNSRRGKKLRETDFISTSQKIAFLSNLHQHHVLSCSLASPCWDSQSE